jgi:hypothetical protein
MFYNTVSESEILSDLDSGRPSTDQVFRRPDASRNRFDESPFRTKIFGQFFPQNYGRYKNSR